MCVMFILACLCNSQGSTESDSSSCDGLCNCDSNGECYCTSGYEGNDCNICSAGYFMSDTSNGENTCTGIEKKSWH